VFENDRKLWLKRLFLYCSCCALLGFLHPSCSASARCAGLKHEFATLGVLELSRTDHESGFGRLPHLLVRQLKRALLFRLCRCDSSRYTFDEKITFYVAQLLPSGVIIPPGARALLNAAAATACACRCCNVLLWLMLRYCSSSRYIYCESSYVAHSLPSVLEDCLALCCFKCCLLNGLHCQWLQRASFA
jgi:hypothetical protein